MDLAKEFFGMTVKTAYGSGKCVSCKEKVSKMDLKRSSNKEAYGEYISLGLCLKCQEELGPMPKVRRRKK